MNLKTSTRNKLVQRAKGAKEMEGRKYMTISAKAHILLVAKETKNFSSIDSKAHPPNRDFHARRIMSRRRRELFLEFVDENHIFATAFWVNAFDHNLGSTTTIMCSDDGLEGMLLSHFYSKLAGEPPTITNTPGHIISRSFDPIFL